jgi:hypothetical protein
MLYFMWHKSYNESTYEKTMLMELWYIYNYKSYNYNLH